MKTVCIMSSPPQNHTLYHLLRSGQFQHHLMQGQHMRWGHNHTSMPTRALLPVTLLSQDESYQVTDRYIVSLLKISLLHYSVHVYNSGPSMAGLRPLFWPWHNHKWISEVMKVNNYEHLYSTKPVIQFILKKLRKSRMPFTFFISRLPSQKNEGEAIFVAK